MRVWGYDSIKPADLWVVCRGKGGIGDYFNISTIKEDFILPVHLLFFPEPQRS